MKPPSATSAFQWLAVIFLALLSAATTGRAGSVAAPYAIGTWEGFRPAAISYTFDDNLPNQYAIAVPMFHAAGLKMTLFTVVNTWVGTFTWAQAQNAASLGDEIASHTMTHPDLTTVPATQLTNELENSQSNINARITNELCVTLAYPDCTVPSEAVTAQYYIAARTCSGSLVPATPPDYYQISSYILGNTGSYTTGASINALADSAVTQQRWCVYLTHAIDGDNGYSPLSSTALQASVYYTSTNQSKFWVETFGNVVRYIKERNASSIAETTNTGSSITVQVTNNLNNAIYNYPITLRRPMPAGWVAAAVTQNGQPITANLVTVNSTNYVMFDVVPNGGNAIISQVNSQGNSLQLTVPASATEGDGLLAGRGSITANPAPTNDLVVTLTSGNTNKVTVPPSVVISAGQTNAVFDLTIIDNTLLDGNQSASITATAPGYGSSQGTILVSNNNTATLTVTLPASAVKGAGTLVNAGLVSASSAVAANYTVNLVSSDASKLAVPSAVVIPAGQSSVPFNLTILSNTLIDGPKAVTVTAHVSRWTDGFSSMTILDNNPPPDHFVWSSVPSPQFAGQSFPVTITAQDINNVEVNYMLPVNIGAWVPGTTPATNTVFGPPVNPDSMTDGFEYVLGYSFTPSTNLVVTSFRHYFGDNVSLWTDSGVLLASQNVVSVPGTWLETPLTNPVVLLAGVAYRIGVHENGVAYYFDDTPHTSFPDGAINAYWYAYGDTFPNAADTVMYYVDLRYSTDVKSVPINPVVSGNFTNGVWVGNLAVLQPAASLTVQSSITGHSGQSLPFDVLNAPRLSIASSGGSVVASWPVVPAGFSLEETPVLTVGAIWTGVPGSSVVGDLNIATNTPPTTIMFYRLHKH